MKIICAFLALSLPASAATVVQGGSLFTQAYADQFAAWLGEGDVTLTNVHGWSGTAFTVTDSQIWHTQVDNLGRTVTLILTDLGLVGGYNPVSWNAALMNYVQNPTDAGRTAFIFNLSDGVLQRQILASIDGSYQTYNHPTFGPTFGGGWDLIVYPGSGNNYANAYAYGGGQGTANIFGFATVTGFQVLGVETFTIASGTAVPEPATWALLLAGLALTAGRGFASMSLRESSRMIVLGLSLLLCALPARASTVVVGGSLFTQTHADQFATWLGEGDLTLTNVYSQGPGFISTDAQNWHNQVDNIGRTVTLILTDLGLVGGYNPTSWNSTGGYVFTTLNADRTAFIFNFTSGVIQRQILDTFLYGAFQTLNEANAGPVFGAGWDLSVGGPVSARSLAYGPGSELTNIFGFTGTTSTGLLGMETFTIASAVPEPETAPLVLATLAILATLRARAAASRRP